MNNQQINELAFFLATDLALSFLTKKRVKTNSLDDIEENIKNSAASIEIRTLFNILNKEINQHNSTIEAQQSKIRAMRYSDTFYKSSYFKDVNVSGIIKILNENPDEATFAYRYYTNGWGYDEYNSDIKHYHKIDSLVRQLHNLSAKQFLNLS